MKKKVKFILILTTLTGLLYIVLPLTKANAQEVSLSIYPPIMQVDSTPPSEPKGDIFLQNLTDKTIDLNVVLKPFNAAASKDGQIKIEDTFQNFPDPLFANRIKILDNGEAVKIITLAPQQGKKLQLDLQIPASEEKGDYYFSVIFVANNTPQTLANSSVASGAVAMNVLLTVGPKGPTSGFISEFSTPFFTNNGPVPFKVSLTNQSDHFVTPTGTIEITNMFGQKIGKVDLLPVNILSNSQRLIPDLNQSNVDSKDYPIIRPLIDNSTTPLAIWPEKFLIGPYKATISIKLAENAPTLSRSITFIAFPINYMLGLILLFIICIFIILRVKKRIA